MNAANPHTPSLLLAATAEAVSGTSYSGGGKSLIFNNKESAKREHGPCVVSATDMAHGLFYAPAVALPARSNDSTAAMATAIQEAMILSPLRPQQPEKQRFCHRYGHSSPRSNDSTTATVTATQEAMILPLLRPQQSGKRRFYLGYSHGSPGKNRSDKQVIRIYHTIIH